MLKQYPFAKTLFFLFIGVIFSLFCVWMTPGNEKGIFYDVRSIIGFVFSTLVPVSLAIYALLAVIKAQTKSKGLIILLFSYISLLFSFSSAYYTICWFGDLRDTTEQIYYYSQFNYNKWNEVEQSDLPYRTQNHRAFKGIETKLWLGIEDTARPYFCPNIINTPVREIMKRAEGGKEHFLYHGPIYCSDNKWEVFLDCLHYSIATIATVGYGDITPQTRWAKTMTDIEIISGQALFVFALGYVFGKVGENA